MVDESWYRRPPQIPEHTSAGGVIVRREGGRIYVALVREGNLPGYVLPKGRVEPGEALELAARREIAEEAGLADLSLLDELGVWERLNYDRSSWKRTHYFLFLARQPEGEQHRVAWFPIDALPPMFWREQRELLVAQRDRIERLVTAPALAKDKDGNTERGTGNR